MKNKWKLTVGILLLLAVGCIGGWYYVNYMPKGNPVEEYGPSTGSAEVSEPTEDIAAYVSPIDFAGLQSMNADVCAWVQIPDTEISYPVLQNAEENEYYLNHSIEGERSSSGAIFIENYNRNDFSDTVNVIYGHDMKSGDFFGSLQITFSDQAQFEKSRNITLYLPDHEETYRVFAAVPYDNRHVLDYYNYFQSDENYVDFMKSVTSIRGLDAIVDEQSLPQTGEKLLVLSTCLKGDHSRRFLVIGTLQDGSDT